MFERFDITINPTHLSDNDKKILFAALANKDAMLFEKNKNYDINGKIVRFTHHLIRSTINPNANTFYVVANTNNHLGMGAFSKFRQTVLKISVNESNESLQIETPKAGERKVLRINNPQSKKQDDYTHKETIDLNDNEKKYSHLSIETPIAVTKTKKGNLLKSYTLMNEIPGQTAQKEMSEYTSYRAPTTLQIVTEFIIPLLQTYKDQIVANNMVHRDIKPPNIMADSNYNKSTNSMTIAFNFFDVDRSVPMHTFESGMYGSLGYIDPDLIAKNAAKQAYKATTARDIFALGATLVGCINPDLEIESFLNLRTEKATNPTTEALKLFNELMEKQWMDPTFLINKLAETDPNDYSATDRKNMPNQFFRFIVEDNDQSLESAAREDILTIIQGMTNTDPNKRYQHIDEIIQAFAKVAHHLDPTFAIAVEKTPISTTAKLLSTFSSHSQAVTATPAITATPQEALPVQSTPQDKSPEEKPIPATTTESNPTFRH